MCECPGICATCVYTRMCMPSVRECAKTHLSAARLPQEPPSKRPGDIYRIAGRGAHPSEAAGILLLHATLDAPAIPHVSQKGPRRFKRKPRWWENMFFGIKFSMPDVGVGRRLHRVCR